MKERINFCTYFGYGGACLCKSGQRGAAHMLIGCEWTTKDGYPSPIRQSRHCEFYKPITRKRND